MRTPWLLVWLPLVLTGCYVGPVFKLKPQNKRTCNSTFLAWSGGLTYHVLQGPGDGTFDYDPLGDLVDRVEGAYSLESGDFWWRSTYADDAYRVSDQAIGFGTLWRDGDMDVEYELEVLYDDESARTWDVRTERWGCKETTRTEDEEGNLSFVQGTHSDSGFDYVHEWVWGPLVVEAEGTRGKDGRWDEAVDYEDGGLLMSYEETGDGEGHVTRTFDTNDGLQALEGSWERFRDGETVMDYTSKSPGSKKQFWTYTVDGNGDGEGSWEQDGVTCNLKFTDFECKRRQCSDDSNGTCSPPVAFPPL